MNKKNSSTSSRAFKPKKVIFGGTEYYVTTADELHKIKSTLELKKQEHYDQLEDEKNKKVLIKKVHNSGNKHIHTVKIVTDPQSSIQLDSYSMMQVRNQGNQNIPLAIKQATVFKNQSQNTLTSAVLARSSNFQSNQTSQSNQSNQSNQANQASQASQANKSNPVKPIYHPKQQTNNLSHKQDSGSQSHDFDYRKNQPNIQSNTQSNPNPNPNQQTGIKVRPAKTSQIKKNKQPDPLPEPEQGHDNNDDNGNDDNNDDNGNDDNNDKRIEQSNKSVLKIKPAKTSMIRKNNLVNQQTYQRNGNSIASNGNGNSNGNSNGNTQDPLTTNEIASDQSCDLSEPETGFNLSGNQLDEYELDKKIIVNIQKDESKSKSNRKIVVDGVKLSLSKEVIDIPEHKYNINKIYNDEIDIEKSNGNASDIDPDTITPQSPTESPSSSNLSKLSSSPSPSTTSDYFNKSFDVLKNQWYVIAIKADDKQGILKILDQVKTKICPVFKINNNMLIYKRHSPSCIEYRIYFRTLHNTVLVDIHILGILISDIKINKISPETLIKLINLDKFRKFYDLELTNYYLTNAKLIYPEKFIDRFNADHTLYTNIDYFDKFIKQIKIDTRTILLEPVDDSITNVLYLTHQTIEYDYSDNATRTHQIAKYMNASQGTAEPIKYNILCVSRYGYPYDMVTHDHDVLEPVSIIDNVTYVKLINTKIDGSDPKDNFNCNNIIEYIKKYIINLVRTAIKYRVKLIHSTSNYINGLACLYAAKYLGIRSVYEVRGSWDSGLASTRPEIANSDLMRLIRQSETKVYNMIDKLVVPNEQLACHLINDMNVNEDKIVLLPDSVDPDPNLYTLDSLIKTQLLDELNVTMISNTKILGYVGNLTAIENIDMICRAIDKLKHVYDIKFVIVGNGSYLSEINRLALELGIVDNIIHVGGMGYPSFIKYYNLFDVAVFPRKSNDYTNLVSNCKVMESMLMARPIVVSDLKIYDNVVINQDHQIVKLGDLDDLVDKLDVLFKDPGLCVKLGNDNRDHVIDRYNWDHSIKKLVDMYYDLLIN